MGVFQSKESQERRRQRKLEKRATKGARKKGLRRTKSLKGVGKAKSRNMSRTKSMIYDDEGGEIAQFRAKNASAQLNADGTMTPTSTWGKDGSASAVATTLPQLTFGAATVTGEMHDNEDRYTAIGNLFRRYGGPDALYSGDADRTLAFFGVYDGHGGDETSEYLRRNLHAKIAATLWRQNSGEGVSTGLVEAFARTEDVCVHKDHGSCCCTVLFKGTSIYCANCGDSKALLFRPDGKATSRKYTEPKALNGRHGSSLPSENRRILAAHGRIDSEGAVYVRDDATGFFMGLFPTRGFGDGLFKVAAPNLFVAIPEGCGVGQGEPRAELEPDSLYWLVIASDGLWDFVTDDVVMKKVLAWASMGKKPKQIAEELVTMAQRKYDSYDDVTAIVIRIET